MYMDKYNGGNMARKIVLTSFEFTDHDPSFTPRTPYNWMNDEDLRAIAAFPFILDEACPFCAVFKVGEQNITLRGVVPKGFTYNLADIPWILEPLSYDRHSPFVKDASFIHDYLCCRKKILYNDWGLKDKGITPLEFKDMTSIIFCHQLRKNAVPYSKARLMSICVNLWQCTVSEWYTLDKTETSL